MCSSSSTEIQELKYMNVKEEQESQTITVVRDEGSQSPPIDDQATTDQTPTADDVTSHVTNDDTVVLVMSESASVCRICQDGPDTSGEGLDSCRCLCKGHLAKVHRSCLVEWVQYRGSTRCEICGGTFSDIPSPPRGRLGINQLEALEALRQQISRYQPLSRRKRTAIGGAIVFLILVTSVTAVITFGANREFESTNSDPWASEGELNRSHIVFSICVAFLFFCITLTVGLLTLWLVLECYLYGRRRRIMRRAAERILADALAQRPEQSQSANEV